MLLIFLQALPIVKVLHVLVVLDSNSILLVVYGIAGCIVELGQVVTELFLTWGCATFEPWMIHLQENNILSEIFTCKSTD